VTYIQLVHSRFLWIRLFFSPENRRKIISRKYCNNAILKGNRQFLNNFVFNLLVALFQQFFRQFLNNFVFNLLVALFQRPKRYFQKSDEHLSLL